MRLRKKPWIEEAMQDLKGEYVLMHDLENYKGRWQELFPGKRLCLEIGCGKGRFIIGWRSCIRKRLLLVWKRNTILLIIPVKLPKKIRWIISRSSALMQSIWRTGSSRAEIKELYLNFSDPWPKARHAKRRLTHRNFLAKYQRLLGKGGHLRFKTDNRALFDFSVEEFKEFGLEIIALSYDLHNSDYDNEVQTEYERKFSSLGTPINFCEVVF